MKIRFTGLDPALEKGLDLCRPLGFERETSGQRISIKRRSGPILVESDGEIQYQEPVHFFRALGYHRIVTAGVLSK